MNKLDKGINKLVKAVASVSVLGFSAISLLAAVVAWFASNNSVSNTGMNINAQRTDGKLRKVYFYGFNGYEDDAYLFNTTPLATYTYNWENREMDPGVFTGDPNWSVPMYDSLSKYQSLLMIFEYDQEYTSEEDGEFAINLAHSLHGNKSTYNLAFSKSFLLPR